MSADIEVNVLFFGRLADLVTESKQPIKVCEQTSAAMLYDQLRENNPQLLSREQDKSLNVAINQNLVDWDSLLVPGDEVAFMPPVTGG